MKIINIIHFPFAYHMLEDEEPEVRWETGEGNWCGIWKGNWSHRLGDALLNTAHEVIYEVWRPDLRVDKTYTHTFENGLVYKLFPAFVARAFNAFKIRSQLYCPDLIQGLKEMAEKEEVIIHLNSSPLIHINCKIIKTVSQSPIIVTLHGNQEISGSRVPVYHRLKQHHIRKKWKIVDNKIQYITFQNSGQEKMLQSLGMASPMELVTMGCDFDFWVPSGEAVTGHTVKFLMACRFVPLKQVDRIIRIFLDLDQKYDFLLTIAGSGEREYTTYLKKLAMPLIKKNKAIFTGFLTDKQLLKEYQMHDYFIMASKAEGCPVSVMQAMACNLRIFTTSVGCTADLLEKHQAGVILSLHDFEQWKLNLITILKGEHVRVLDREIARERFDWLRIAGRFYNIYKRFFDFY